MTDQYDEIAAKLLPCNCGTKPPADHHWWCAVFHRPSVAAELRRMDEARKAAEFALGRASAELDAAYRALDASMNWDGSHGFDIGMKSRHGGAIAKARKHVEEVQ